MKHITAGIISLVLYASVQADTLIVLNKSEATASLIDLKQDKAVATVPTGVGPHEVAVSADGKQALVTNYGTREAAGSTITVIDVPSAHATKTIDLSPNQRPHGIAWIPKSSKFAVTVEDNKAVLIVNAENGKIEKTIATGQEISHMLVISPDGTRAYVASIGSGTVTVLDLSKGERLEVISTGAGAEGIDMTPNGEEVWITNRAADNISVLDTRTNKVVATLESKSFPIRARVTPDGKTVLISNARSGEVAVFDAGTKKEIRRIPIPQQGTPSEGRLMNQFGNSSVPIGILFPPDGKRAFVALANADAIVVLDLLEGKFKGALTAGKEPDGLGYSSVTVTAAAK